MAKEVKLLGTWSSPFSYRVQVALKLKGIEYEYIEEDLSNKSPLLHKLNPIHKKIPVLVHNGKAIAESLIILEYIDETWPKNHPLLPKDPYGRAMARFWAKFIDDKILPAVRLVATKKGEELNRVIEETSHSLQLIEKELEGKDYFGGHSIGYLDIVATDIAFWYVRTQQVVGLEFLTEQKFPLLFRWIEKLNGIAAVNECCPPREKHIAYMKDRLAKMRAVAE